MGRKLLTAVTALLLATAGVASATCSQAGKVVRITTTSAGNSVINLASLTAGTTTFVWQYLTPDDGFTLMLASAQSANETVVLAGTAGFCPAFGPIRAGGTLTTVDILRNN
jgi:hypothetical protein